MTNGNRWFSRASRISLLALAVGALALGQSGARADYVIDLTTAGALDSTHSGVVGGQFIVQQVGPQPTGTGYIDSFVRIKHKGNEQGYNTSDYGSQAPMDDLSGTFTHALNLSDIPVVTIGGVAYRQFLLDINQDSGGNDNFLSLNQIQLFQSNTDVADVSATTASAGTPPVSSSATRTLVFQMSAGSGAFGQILLDYALNSGSGSGDMFLYVRNDAFAPGQTYVTLYSQFGNPPGQSGSNDGFEEWAVLQPSGSPTPGPSTAVLAVAGLGLLGVPALRRFRRAPAFAMA